MAEDHNTLGRFLRQRREAVPPESVGLPPGGRRRTPGLRRAELATLAGLSVDYLTRLEQGKDRNPSPQVLNALAETLLLDFEERHLLLKLGSVVGSGSELCPGIEPPSVTVRPTLAAILERLEPAPAIVRNRLTDILGATDAWRRVAGPIGLGDGLDEDELPNQARHLLTDPRARELHPAWDRAADEMAALLRSWNRPDDTYYSSFVTSMAPALPTRIDAALRAGPVVAPRPGPWRLVHPVVGELILDLETLEVARADQQLLVYLPADDATAAALDRLVDRRPGTLHAVPG
jgi:transcriptional regulator with XRE-family HTH domain